jgi:hypothetical protein
MGAVKQMLIKEAEKHLNEIEDIIDRVEQEVGNTGQLSSELFYKLCEAYLAYAKIFPDDDMAEFGRMFLDAMELGRMSYMVTGRYEQ